MNNKYISIHAVVPLEGDLEKIKVNLTDHSCLFLIKHAERISIVSMKSAISD